MQLVETDVNQHADMEMDCFSDLWRITGSSDLIHSAGTSDPEVITSIRTSSCGLMYVIAEEKDISSLKIGITKTLLSARISQLNTGNHRPLRPVMVFAFHKEANDHRDRMRVANRAESRCHEILAGLRIRGEWFRCTPRKILDVVYQFHLDDRCEFICRYRGN